ncbi:hypothetical protein SCLCIDRAFT_797262 [Scleroderma citrinum Foug A]|uniref:Uncharacterized protein n=1 Tax=Scleroderma citrinum Foug A TaxID=1036808 RepID=A0A0C3ACM6_9AGAM|nr:hypothetical protein SCLCIDRAFT_797262 [Scleroderma citrinum Foug A]
MQNEGVILIHRQSHCHLPHCQFPSLSDSCYGGELDRRSISGATVCKVPTSSNGICRPAQILK